MSERIKKINHLILEELGKVILREIEFPKNVFVTLQKIETTKDLSGCKVSIAVFSQESGKQIVFLLNKESKHLHHLLSKKIVLRKIPHLRFVLLDERVDPERLEGLLDEIGVEDESKNK